MPDIKYAPVPEDSSPIESDDDLELGQTVPVEASSEQVPPENPPPYEPGTFEEFEIEEPEGDLNAANGFLGKAGQFARGINTRIFRPIHNALDPVYEALQFINNRCDTFIAKVGNPLIIKRLLYVLFVAIIIYMISVTGINATGGAYYGSFHDIDKLGSFVDDKIDPHRLEENLEYLSSMPHLAGSAGDLAFARYVQQYIRRTNLQETNGEQQFNTFTEYPTNQSYVWLLKGGQKEYECNLHEEVKGDANADDVSRWAFNPGSRTGTAKGKPIYANYGLRSDYEQLKARGVQLSNFVAIIRYGEIDAYKKVRYAAEAGASAVLFISNPSADSPYTMESIQREPVAYADSATGDILVPGLGSADQVPDYFDTNKLLSGSSVYPAIPSIPISLKDFANLSKSQKGSGTHMGEWDIELAGEEIEIWTGSEDYSLDLSNDLLVKPLKEVWNIVGRIEGTEQDVLSVVIGASRDSVCNGATEATGTAVLLELMSVLSELVSAMNWRPLRSIYFVSFSGSKFNVAGATHLDVHQREFIKRSVYAYIDLGAAVAGHDFKLSANPLLYNMMVDIMRQTTEPVDNKTILSVWNKLLGNGYETDPLKTAAPFITHGVLPTLEAKFDNATSGYPQNSCLDTFQRFKDLDIDPGMGYHKSLTSVLARALIALSDNPIIPFDIYQFVTTVDENLKDLETYADKSGKNLNYNSLRSVLLNMKQLSREQQGFESTWRDIVDSNSGIEPNLLSVNRWDWNSKLAVLHKAAGYIKGTENNHWQRNLLFGRQKDLPENFASDVHYRTDTFPGIRDAISAGDKDGAQEQVDHVTEALKQVLSIFMMR